MGQIKDMQRTNRREHRTDKGWTVKGHRLYAWWDRKRTCGGQARKGTVFGQKIDIWLRQKLDGRWTKRTLDKYGIMMRHANISPLDKKGTKSRFKDILDRFRTFKSRLQTHRTKLGHPNIVRNPIRDRKIRNLKTRKIETGLLPNMPKS